MAEDKRHALVEDLIEGLNRGKVASRYAAISVDRRDDGTVLEVGLGDPERDCWVLPDRGTRMDAGGRVSDDEPVRTAVLLAAGLGSRLAPFTDAVPKCLVRLNGVPILQRLVDALDGLGFTRLVVVVGYRAEAIPSYLGSRFGGIAIEYVVSHAFETTNNIYSLWLTRGLIDEPILLVESDLVFDPELLASLRCPDRIAVSRQLPWMSGSTVTLDGEGQVDAFYPDSPEPGFEHCTDGDHFMAVNIYSLSRDSWRETCLRLDQHVTAGQTGDFYEVVFAEMVADGWLTLTAVAFPTDRWYEIDSVADLHASELVFAGQQQAAGTDGPAVPTVGTAT